MDTVEIIDEINQLIVLFKYDDKINCFCLVLVTKSTPKSEC